jgi:hypothetical protein
MFSFFKPKLIQWGDGTFSIRRLSILGQEYLSRHGYWLLSTVQRFDTEEDLMKAYEKTTYKVVATLDDEWDL